MTTLVDFLYPTNIFCWGKEINRYNSRKELRKNLFWGGLVGLFLTIAGSFIYSKVLNGPY